MLYYIVGFYTNTFFNLDDCGPLEGLTDSDEDQCSLATPKERYLHGMLRGKQLSRSNVQVKMRSDGQRGAYAAKLFKPGDFICEYAACVKKQRIV